MLRGRFLEQLRNLWTSGSHPLELFLVLFLLFHNNGVKWAEKPTNARVDTYIYPARNYTDVCCVQRHFRE